MAPLVGWHLLPGRDDLPDRYGGCVTLLDIHGAIPEAAAPLPRNRLRRIYYKGRPDPVWVAERARTWLDRGENVVIGNEPNLDAVEHFLGTPLIYSWLVRAVLALLPEDLHARVWYAGPSPGVPDWQSWLTDPAAQAAIDQLGGVAIHAYGNLAEIKETVWLAKSALSATCPLWLSEMNYGAGRSVDRNAWAKATIRPLLDWLAAAVPTCVAVTYFAWTWSTPDMSLPTPVDAKGTAIVDELLDWRPAAPSVVDPPPAPPRRLGPTGRGWWVWYADSCGGAAGIIKSCRATGASWVAVKGGDGPSVWSNRLTPELIAELRAAGLAVYGWVYAYGGWLRGTAHGTTRWTVEDEIRVAEAVAALDIDGLILDVEAEYEGRAGEATAYAAACRAAIGDDRWLAYAPLPVIDYHQLLPYAQFNRVCDAVLPQWYVSALDRTWSVDELAAIWQSWSEKWRGWHVPVPRLDPVGQAYGDGTAEDVTAIEQWAAATGARAWSYWSLDEARTRPDLLAAMTADPPMPPIDLPEPPDDITRALDRLWADTELVAAAGEIRRAEDNQRAIDTLKHALGRP